MNKFICSGSCQGTILTMHVMADSAEDARRAFDVSLWRMRWPSEYRRDTTVMAAPDKPTGNRFFDWQHHGWYGFTGRP